MNNNLNVLPMWPELYASKPYPYYIISPGYLENVPESVIMHYLCHALNLLGQEAYLVGTPKTKQGLRTPSTGDGFKNLHGKTCIAIYPEKVKGNPLYAPVVARYIFDETIVLDGTEMNANDDDFFFYQNDFEQSVSRPVDGFLCFPLVDTSIYNLPTEEVQRENSYFFLGEKSEASVDFLDLPEGVELLSTKHDYTANELADLFKKARVLYASEVSLVCTKAILCGCPVVFFPAQNSEDLDLKRLGVGAHGWTLHDTEEGLRNARASIEKAFQYYHSNIERFWKQLSHFILTTQQRARQAEEQLKHLEESKLEITTYMQWRECRKPSPERVALGQAILQANDGQKRISVLLCDASSTEDLQRTLESIARQTELPANIWIATKRKRENIESNLKLQLIPESPVKAFQEILAAGNGGCLWLVYGGELFHPNALQILALNRLTSPAVAAWYCDIEYFDEQGALQPLLYPDFNLDLFRSYPYMGRSVVLELDKFRPQAQTFSNAELFGLECIFYALEAGGPPAVKRIPEVLLTARRSTLTWALHDKTTRLFTPLLREHLNRLGFEQADIRHKDGIHSIIYNGGLRPKVSILIPTRDMFEVLRILIDSLMARTNYPDYELILIDHETLEPGARKFLDSLALLGDKVKVVPWTGKFNYSDMINRAAEHASGEILLLLDNDVEIIDADWLEALVNHVVRPEVGVVGPRLELADGQIDQAGLIVGIEGAVGHLFRGLKKTDTGYMKRLQATSNVSAVSSTCLMVRKQVFEELGGLDADTFPVYYGDVDFCLRAAKNGYLTVYAPESKLRHMGGATRLLTEQFGVEPAPSDIENKYFYQRWAEQLGNDPGGHPAYSRYSEHLTLDLTRARIPATLLPGRPLPGVMAIHAGWSGCANYRLLQPLQALERHLLAEAAAKQGDFNLADVALFKPDVTILQGTWGRDGIVEKIQHVRNIFGVRVLMDFDDYNFNIPVHNAHKRFFPKDAARKMRRAIEVCDGLIVSTQPLAEELEVYHEQVQVMHNRLDPSIWQHLRSERGAGKKVRVGWAGGTSHTGDLMLIRDLIKAYEGKVEWVFMGMKPEGVRCEFHTGVSFEQYPAKLASLNLDIAVVPLELNRFNECKSNLRLLELGILGIPIICTDIEPYRCGLPVTKVRNRFQEWDAALAGHLDDLEAAYDMGDKLRESVIQDWMLDEPAAQSWARAWIGG